MVGAEQEAVDEAVRAVEEDRRVAVGFLSAPWPPLDAFLRLDGPALMLELVLASPGERHAIHVHNPHDDRRMGGMLYQLLCASVAIRTGRKPFIPVHMRG